MASYANLKIGEPKNSEIEIEGEIPVEVMELYIKSVRDKFRENFEAPGFRRGRVPEEIFKNHVSEMGVLEEAAEGALKTAYPEIVRGGGIKPLGAPLISVTKIAPKNPLGFKMHVGIVPEVSLPNYQKISRHVMAEKQEEVAATDSELNDLLKQFENMLKGANGNNAAGASPLTDESVKKFGDFKDVEDFKNKMRENIKKEKEIDQKRLKREKLAEELIKGAKIIIPELVISQEISGTKERLREDAERAGIPLEEYLKKIHKTEAELLEEQRGYIERQMKMRFILEKIADKEKIEVPEEDVLRETDFLRTRYKDSPLENLKDYARLLIRNEKVLMFLERDSYE